MNPSAVPRPNPRSIRALSALASALSQLPASSASLVALAQAGPVSFLR